MTIYDAQLELDASAVVWSTGFQNSQNFISIANFRDFAAGTPLFIEIQVTTSFATSDGATMVFSVVVSNETSLAGDSQIVGALGTSITPMTAAMLVAGARFTIPIGTVSDTVKTLPNSNYISVLGYTTNNWTAGRTNMRVVLNQNDDPAWKTFAVNSKMALDH